MPETYENQKCVCIHKPRVKDNFLQISNEEWMQANKVLSPYGLQLYLYLASNANNYRFALSPTAANDYAGIRSTSFHKYLRRLEEEGYIVWRHGNLYDFYTSPRPENERSSPDKHVDGIFFEELDNEMENEAALTEVLSSLCDEEENAARSVTSPDDPRLSFYGSVPSPSSKEIENRYIDKDREAKTNKTDAGDTPAPPASPAAGAAVSPSRETIICIPAPVRRPMRGY